MDVVWAAIHLVYLGLMMENYEWLPTPTKLSKFLGMVSRFVSEIMTVMMNIKIMGFEEVINPFMGEVISFGPFLHFWLARVSVCFVG